MDFTPTTAQKNEALSQHVYYEIGQILATMISLHNLPIDKSLIGGIGNALVEARLIHIRALVHFYERGKRDKRGKDDILSSDYGFGPQKVSINESYKVRLNKDLAHLTYSRTERQPEDKPWLHEDVVLPILRCSEKFCDHLISNYLPKNCPEKIPEWKQLADNIKIIISGFP